MAAARTATGSVATTVLGRTNLTVSRMALGGYDALDQAGFERAIELGINYLISFPGYEGEQRAIGQAARHVDRGRMVLATGAAGRSASTVRRALKRSLASLRTNYVDIFYLYHVTCDAWPRICAPGGALQQLSRARRAGLVHFVGATVHNRDLACRIITSDLIDVVNLRYSPAHPGHEARVLPAAIRCNCGVVAYSALKYGLLVNRPANWPPRRRIPTPRDCYRFVLSHPAVHVAWMGARSVQQVEANVDVIRPLVPLSSSTRKRLLRFGRHVHDAFPDRPRHARRPMPRAKRR
jgi:predicted aldo/keto reductase-like oxidoreductase